MKKKKPKSRNPVAKNLRVNKPKVIPNKKKINSRTKGKVGELEFATFLRGRGLIARRGQQFKGGADSPDVVGLPGFHIEVKRTEKGNLYNWMHQACTDVDICNVPVVAHRKNNKHWVIIIDARDFINLVEQAHAKESQGNAGRPAV